MQDNLSAQKYQKDPVNTYNFNSRPFPHDVAIIKGYSAQPVPIAKKSIKTAAELIEQMDWSIPRGEIEKEDTEEVVVEPVLIRSDNLAQDNFSEKLKNILGKIRYSTVAIFLLFIVIGGFTLSSLQLNKTLPVSQQPKSAESTSQVKAVSNTSPPQLDKPWIKDKLHGFYIWNRLAEDYTVEWNGGYTIVDGNQFVNGFGKATWYKNGVFVESHEGQYKNGKRNGNITQRYADGIFFIKKWDEERPVVTNQLALKDGILAEIKLGSNINEAKWTLGGSLKVENKKDGTVYIFNKGVEITVIDKAGTIGAITIDKNMIATSRGISVGDDVNKVLSLYGEADVTSYDRYNLYEYTFEGQPAFILRFAVGRQSRQVEYIGVRLKK